MSTRGIDIRQRQDRIIVRASLKDATGATVVNGTTTAKVYRLEDDGSLSVLASPSTSNWLPASSDTDPTPITMAHQQHAGTPKIDTGLWSYVIAGTALAAFDRGHVYIFQVANAGAFPNKQEREWQFGDVEGDQATLDMFSGEGDMAVQATVVDTDEPPNVVVGASVTFWQNQNRRARAVTGDDGVADGMAVEVGEHTLAVTCNGYLGKSQSATVTGNGQNFDVVLTAVPDASPSAPGLTVVTILCYDEFIDIEQLEPPAGDTGKMFDGGVVRYIPVAGQIELELYTGATYQWRGGTGANVGRWKSFKPTGLSYLVASHVGA